MHIIRTPAYQGHAVPQTAGRARGPFNPEVLAEPVVVVEPRRPEAFNATAQNNYRGERIFQCTYCTLLIPESRLDEHYCTEDPDGEE